MNIVYNNMSQEWNSITSNSYFKASTIYSYTEWKHLQEERFDIVECRNDISEESLEWNSMLRSDKPPKTVQYVKKELLCF